MANKIKAHKSSSNSGELHALPSYFIQGERSEYPWDNLPKDSLLTIHQTLYSRISQKLCELYSLTPEDWSRFIHLTKHLPS